MKIKDYISKCIQEYPSLYKDVDYEKSKLKVLNQIFLVIGNGLDLAETENPEEGGYVVDAKYKKVKGEYVRKKDKPYGKEKYKALTEDYFKSTIYYVYPREIVTVRKGEFGTDALFQYNKKIKDDDVFNKPRLYEAESTHEFSPYPLSQYSLAVKVLKENIFLQPDWIFEMVIVCEKALEYFNDKERYQKNTYYPNEHRINQDLNYFKSRFEKDGVKGVRDLRKTWGYEIKDATPDYAEIEKRKTDSWNKFYKEQIELYTEIIQKFKVQ